MTDIKIKDGDAVVDSSGQHEMIYDSDALFQRVQICIGARLGKFVYDRELGSYVREIARDTEYARERAELVINEALAEFENTYASVSEYGEFIKLTVTIGDESRDMEVRLYGNI